ncbi:MAG: response regulator [Candidatus Eisenbacteria bacterium]|uniref:histidine kinase n=1 Tax=Eiseniibacteriota bacterium TaxID=2212470 RepID=A0A7Y2E9A3_UNCEI|nr:response regulator [Candidatus Eisenbacteria bacterium]
MMSDATEFERERLKLIKELDLLNAPPKPAYEATIKLAKRISGLPLNMITVIDHDRCWLLAKDGTDMEFMSKSQSICAEAVRLKKPLLVKDLTKDPRISDFPIVTDGGIRFYYGVPIFIKDNFPIGTLCMVDTEPQDLDEERQEGIQHLAQQVGNVIDLQQHQVELKKLNEQLLSEIKVRQATEAELLSAQNSLEERVLVRTNELVDHKDQLQAIYDNIPSGVAVVVEGEVAFSNPAFYRLSGHKQDSPLSVSTLIHGDDLERFESYTRDAKGACEVQDEIRVVHASGEVRWADLRGRHTNFLGKPAFMAVLHDLTAVRQAELERERLHAKLERAQKLESLGALAGGIAHDFNNFLTGILGNTKLVLRSVPEDSDQCLKLKKIEKGANRAAQLCRQMLAYAGRGRFELETLCLSETVTEIATLLEVSLPKKAHLEFNLERPLPHILADSSQVGQVVMNLLTNASDALEDEPGTISVTTGCRFFDRKDLANTYLSGNTAPGEYVYLEVQDTGCGMAPEVLQRVFDPFFTTKEPGRGFGMATVLGIVRSHNGAVVAQSELGEGSRVCVLFPVAPSEMQEATPEENLEIIEDIYGAILVADDEQDIRELYHEILEDAGFEVLSASDGAEAVAMFRTHQSRLSAVILDLSMPKMGGEEVFQEIRSLDKTIRILISSGYDPTELTSGTLGTDVLAFIKKPFDPDEVVATLQDALKIPKKL